MKKVVFLFGLAILTVSAWGMNNDLTRNSQSSTNRRVIQTLTNYQNRLRRLNDGSSAFATPPTSPQSGASANRVDTPNPEGRSNGLPANQPSYNSRLPQYRNGQNPNFFGRRTQSRSNTIHGPHQSNIQNSDSQVHQDMFGITSTRRSTLNQQRDPTNNGNASQIQTRIRFYIVARVETVPQYVGNSSRNFFQPQNQFLQNFAQQPSVRQLQEEQRVNRKRKAPEDELISDSQNDGSKNGWLDNLYNTLIKPDASEASASQVADSVNETESFEDKYDDIPLSQTRKLRKRQPDLNAAFSSETRPKERSKN